MSPAAHLLRKSAGWFCLFMALVGTLIPVLPQIPFLALGAVLLAPYIRTFRRVSAWVHKRFPNTRPHLRRFRIFKRPFGGTLPLPTSEGGRTLQPTSEKHGKPRT